MLRDFKSVIDEANEHKMKFQETKMQGGTNLVPHQSSKGNFTENHHSRQKQTQVIYISGKTSSMQISLPALEMNFQSNSDYSARDSFYFINKIRAPSMLHNVFSDSQFRMRISDVVFENVDSKVQYAVTQSVSSSNIDDEGFSASGEGFSLFTLFNKKFEENPDQESIKNKQPQYMNSVEMVNSIEKQINDSNTDIAQYVFLPVPTTPVGFTDQQLFMFEVFRSTQFEYETSTGKVIITTANKNLRNALKWSNLMNLDSMAIEATTFTEGELVLSSFTLEFFVEYQSEQQSPIATRTARQLGMTLENRNGYFYSRMQTDQTLDTIEYINLFTHDSAVFESLPAGLKDFIDPISLHIAQDSFGNRMSFPYPSNMFFTTSFTIQTTLNTNSWERSGEKSSRIASFEFEKTGQQTSTEELKNDDKVVHQDSIHSLKNFQLHFYDEFGFELSFISDIDIEFIIQFKTDQNPLVEIEN